MDNRFVFLRHGESTANNKSIVCSTIKNGTLPEYGLTDLGVSQITQTATKLQKELDNQDVIIFSSPFTRTIQSALIVKDKLGVDNSNFFISLNLQERDFSKFELQSADNYPTVWKLDKKAEDTKGVEPCNDVYNRIIELIDMINNSYHNKTIILVSHGDTIMIARTVMLLDNPYSHRNYEFIKNAEVLIFEHE